MDSGTVIRAAMEEHLGVISTTLATLVTPIGEAADRIRRCIQHGGQVLAMGNGGSAADAQHFVAELVGRFRRERRPLPAMALTVDPSIITAISNDYGFAEVFRRQILAHARPGDVVVGFSTSGNSENVCLGLDAARRAGAETIALGGGDGGRMRGFSDLAILVPSTSTPRIQEAHITIVHAICEIVESSLAGHDAG